MCVLAGWANLRVRVWLSARLFRQSVGRALPPARRAPGGLFGCREGLRKVGGANFSGGGGGNCAAGSGLIIWGFAATGGRGGEICAAAWGLTEQCANVRWDGNT